MRCFCKILIYNHICPLNSYPGATVLLRDLNSSKVKGTVTTRQGTYCLENISEGDYRLQVSFVGYEGYGIRLQGFKGNLHLGPIFLRETKEELAEVVVTADHILYQSDKMIVYPQSDQIKYSGNVFDLMQKQGLPGLEVNRNEQKMSVDGRVPVYKINGVPKTQADILAIRPKDILRIDYSDTGNARYADKDVGGVIDFILKERTEGGVFSLPLIVSPQTGFINASPYFAYHWKKSEIAWQYYTNWRDYSERVTNWGETYVGDDFLVQRNMTGKDSPFGYWNNGISTTYTYQPDDMTNLTITLRNEFGNQHNTVDGIVDEMNLDTYFRHSKSTYRSYMPSLDLFFSKKWSGNHSLEVNMVGSLLDSEYKYSLEEQLNQPTEAVYRNDVENSRYSLISEVAYSKGLRKSTLNLGLQNTVSYTRNAYSTGDWSIDHLNQNNNYLYTSWSGKIKDLSMTLGTGMKLFFVENNKENRSFIRNRSSLSLSYPLGKKIIVGYVMQYIPVLPGLSQLSNVTQRYDSYLLIKGNPDLKAEQRLTSQVRFNLRDKRWTGYLKFLYTRLFDPIFSEVSYLGARTFVSEYMNYGGSHHFNTEMKLGYNGLFKHLNLRGTMGYQYYNTYGKTFSHYLRNVYWSLLGEVYWGKWELSAYYLKPQKQLLGETIATFENNADIRLAYRPNNQLSLVLICMYPFSSKGAKYVSEQLTAANPLYKEVYIKDNANMLALQVNYTLNFGKGFKKSRRGLSNKDVENGILKTLE